MSCGDKNKCSDCKFYYKQDEGYSNWTVLDTELHCTKKAHPLLPQNESSNWGREEHPFLEVADTCPLFEKGIPVHMDVEKEKIEQGSNNYSPYCESERQHEALWQYKHGEVSVSDHTLGKNERELEKIKLMHDLK